MYPLRSSELVIQGGEALFKESLLPLNPEERKGVLGLDQELFAQLKPIKDLQSEVHTVYPGFFTTKEGWHLFQSVYLANLEGEAVSFKTVKEEKDYHNSVFDRLKEAADKETEATTPPPVNPEEAAKLFFQLENLSVVPTQIRERMEGESSDWARREFLGAFRQADGNVGRIDNPVRVSRIVNVGKLTEKIAGYRQMKKELKARLTVGEGSFSEATKILLDLYRRYLNVLLAGDYDYGRVLGSQPHLSKDEKRALDYIRGSKTKKEDRFSPSKSSRTMERIDHFLEGVGLRVDPDGLWQTTPNHLKDFIEEKARQPILAETPEYQKYNAYRVDAQQAKVLAESILRIYGFDREGWSIYLSPTAKNLAVNFREKGEKIKQVVIPKTTNRGLVDILAVLAHEIEGHVMTYHNAESGGTDLKLIEEFSTGRVGGLHEGGSMLAEDRTKRAICGMSRMAEPFYYLVLREKERGGSFKDCFKTFLGAYATRQGLDLGKESDFQRACDYVYPRTLRIFRRHTPLDDESGFIPTSDQLDYAEQELVAQALSEKGVTKLLFLRGVDLYSLPDLQKLGVLNWGKIQEPTLAVANQIWPQIKEGLDQGKSLEEVLGKMFGQ